MSITPPWRYSWFSCFAFISVPISLFCGMNSTRCPASAAFTPRATAATWVFLTPGGYCWITFKQCSTNARPASVWTTLRSMSGWKVKSNCPSVLTTADGIASAGTPFSADAYRYIPAVAPCRGTLGNSTLF